MEYYDARGWTDGLPVVPVTESYLAEFLATTGRDPDEVLIPMPHLNKDLTVRLAAINAALAGCLPEYFPVVLAAWDAFLRDGMVTRSIWQSTTGTAPFSCSSGRCGQTLGFNSRGNVWGSGFRANATIGRAIRLGAINGLGLKPHVFDQATQGNPAKYSCCIAENEEDSPWPSLAADNGFAPDRQRGDLDRHPLGAAHRGPAHHRPRAAGERLRRLAVPHRRAGAAERRRVHRAQLRARPAVRQARLVQGRRPPGDRRPRAGGPTATSPRPARRRSPTGTGWRLPADHPDAMPQEAPEDLDTPVQLIKSIEAVQIVVAGAPNAGVSSIVETFGFWDRPMAVVKVEETYQNRAGSTWRAGPSGRGSPRASRIHQPERMRLAPHPATRLGRWWTAGHTRMWPAIHYVPAAP